VESGSKATLRFLQS
jgi:ElaB/YqjD/DUF883 family membrane-anchored ribosome-binding protein